MSDAFFAPGRRLHGQVTAPADKSISHRAALFGAMSDGEVRISNYLHAEDTTSTLNAIRALGAEVSVEDSGEVVIRGVGLNGARSPGAAIDVGNAGTLMRLLPGWLAAQERREFELDGDASIRTRPVDRIAEPLRRMGADITATDGRFAPFVVRGTALNPISYELPVASAQVKSCVLIAGLSADGTTTVTEPAPSRDHTERMLVAAGVEVVRAGAQISVSRVSGLQAQSLKVPGDPSSAAFIFTAAALLPRARVLVRDVGANWTRVGFLRILERMGGLIVGEREPLPSDDDPIESVERISDIEIWHAPLRGTIVEAAEVPLAIDELPLVALLGVFAEGETVVRGAQELRVKESDRIAGVVDGLRGLGADIDATDDGFVVSGTGELRGGTIDACGDHRMAMLGAVAGLASREGVNVIGMDAAAVSYPGFERDLARLA
jgi:3-phosphoshikimate 1-carboxyvinyltransferase